MKKLILSACAAMLAGCAALGLQSANSLGDRIAAGYVTVQTIASTADTAAKAGKLSKSDATNVLNVSRAGLAGLSVTQELYFTACPPQPATNEPAKACAAPAAENRLQLVLASMTALQAYLATQGAK